MRIDLFLSTVGLVKRRTIARQLCDAGKVKINDNRAKPGKEIRINDKIGISLRRGYYLITVLDIPQKSIPKKDGVNYYSIEEISDNTREP